MYRFLNQTKIDGIYNGIVIISANTNLFYAQIFSLISPKMHAFWLTFQK